jgi:hypothetical protein
MAEANYLYHYILLLQNTLDPFSFTLIYYITKNGSALESSTFLVSLILSSQTKAPAGSVSDDISKNTSTGQVYDSTSKLLAMSTHSKGGKKGAKKQLPKDVTTLNVPPGHSCKCYYFLINSSRSFVAF